MSCPVCLTMYYRKVLLSQQVNLAFFNISRGLLRCKREHARNDSLCALEFLEDQMPTSPDLTQWKVTVSEKEKAQCHNDILGAVGSAGDSGTR